MPRPSSPSFDRPNIRYTIAELGSAQRARAAVAIHRDRASGGCRHRLLPVAQVGRRDGGVALVERPQGARLPRRARSAAPRRGTDEVPDRRRPHHRRDDRLRHGHRQAGRPLRRAPEPAEVDRSPTTRKPAAPAATASLPTPGWPTGSKTSCSSGSGLPSRKASDAFKKVQRQKLDALIGLAEMPGCRRQALLAYFGEMRSAPCGNCDNCLNPPHTEDGTVMAQKALVCRLSDRPALWRHLSRRRSHRQRRRAHHAQRPRPALGVRHRQRRSRTQTWKGLFRQLDRARLSDRRRRRAWARSC